MKLHTFVATVLVRVGSSTNWVTTEVRAESLWHAQLLLESQYGLGCLIGMPYQKH
jgi:hypothetical protein